jgi:hypothetical protein
VVANPYQTPEASEGPKEKTSFYKGTVGSTVLETVPLLIIGGQGSSFGTFGIAMVLVPGVNGRPTRVRAPIEELLI